MRYVHGGHIIRRTLLPLACMLIAITAARGQTIRIGAGGSYHTTTHNVLIGYPDSLLGRCFQRQRDERGSMEGFSGHIEVMLAPLAGIENLGLLARARWQMMDGESKSDIQRRFGMVDIVGYLVHSLDYPTDYTVQQRHWFTMQSASLDILAEYHLPWSLLVRGGPSLGYRAIGPMQSLEYLLEPQNVRLSNPENLPSVMNGRALICYDSESWPDGSGISLGMIGQVGMSISTASGLVLIPEIGARWEMLPPVTSHPWPTLELSAGLSLAYTLE